MKYIFVMLLTSLLWDAQAQEIDPSAIPVQDELGPPPGNPFRQGLRGNWRVKRSYKLVMERAQTRAGTNDNMNTRTDGIYASFYPFWSPNVTDDNGFYFIDQKSYWTLTNQVNHYNPFGGAVIESVDPLERYSATIFGYNQTLPTGAASNSRYREIGFDGFEDYAYGHCSNNHFTFRKVMGASATDRTSHTGRYSLRIPPHGSITLRQPFAPCEDEPVEVVVR